MLTLKYSDYSQCLEETWLESISLTFTHCFPIMFLSQKPKSTTAADATCDINPDLQVDAHLNKVCPATESIYSDSFYTRLNFVVTALDNVEARRYVDRLVQILKWDNQYFLKVFSWICFPHHKLTEIEHIERKCMSWNIYLFGQQLILFYFFQPLCIKSESSPGLWHHGN